MLNTHVTGRSIAVMHDSDSDSVFCWNWNWNQENQRYWNRNQRIWSWNRNQEFELLDHCLKQWQVLIGAAEIGIGTGIKGLGLESESEWNQ